MLDLDLLNQLRGVFGSLENELTLRVHPSTHEKQAEMVELATELASTSPKLRYELAGEAVDTVLLEIIKDGAATGIRFAGVPGGHEFTSLVLAVLNSDGKGKLPDAGLRARVRSLRGPAALRTFISLSCTNCPDVVQALNLIALDHPGISHEMIDGGLAPDAISALGVQAVPSVFLGDKLISVGKSSYGELLEILARELGTDAAAVAEQPPQNFDVVVLGAGPAGIAAAIYTARKGLKTAIVAEKMGGQVADTLGIENLIGTNYTEGPKLVVDLEKHARVYPIEILSHRRVESMELPTPDAANGVKRLKLATGEVLLAPTVIIATGAKWRELGVPGEKQYLGRGVAFCPHCDGPFYKGRRVAVIGGGNSGVEAAIDLAGIASHVTLIEYADELKADAVLITNLRARGNVTIISSARTTEVLGDDAKVTGLRYEDRRNGEIKSVDLDGVFVQIGLVPNSAAFRELVKTSGFGEIIIDDKGRTSAPGVYAAGDVTTVPFKQIVIAMGSGATAALTAFEDQMRAG